jgi:hypothetical protein
MKIVLSRFNFNTSFHKLMSLCLFKFSKISFNKLLLILCNLFVFEFDDHIELAYVYANIRV